MSALARFKRIMVLSLGLSAFTFAAAQEPEISWPTKPVRWIVPFGAGGPADVIARILAVKLGDKWGKPVVVENRPGANGVVGAMEVVRSAPDGHTVLHALNSMLTVNKFAFSKLQYDPQKDFTPVALIATLPVVLFANETVPSKDLSELVSTMKKDPGRVTLGSATVGLQLAGELFSRDASVQFEHVPYKSGSDVTKAMLTGEINTAVDAAVAYMPYVKSGRLKALAVNSKTRASALPNVPTLTELGFANSQAALWHCLLAPANLDSRVKKKISDDLRAALEMPDVREKLVALGLEPTWASDEQLIGMVKEEEAKLGPLVKALGIKFD